MSNTLDRVVNKLLAIKGWGQGDYGLVSFPHDYLKTYWIQYGPIYWTWQSLDSFEKKKVSWFACIEVMCFLGDYYFSTCLFLDEGLYLIDGWRCNQRDLLTGRFPPSIDSKKQKLILETNITPELNFFISEMISAKNLIKQSHILFN